MTLLSPITISAGESQAQKNFSKNLAALRISQPALANLMRELPTDLTWTFARDGSLSALTPAGLWWMDCSVPLLAGRALLETLEISNSFSCYLDPTSAGLIRASLERNGDEAPLLAVVREIESLKVMLVSEDFSSEIRSHHLWFSAGENWSETITQLFTDHPGLITPTRFIRTKLSTDEIVDPMIAKAQNTFSTIITQRSQDLASIIESTETTPEDTGILLIAGDRFRLWDNSGQILASQIAQLSGSITEQIRFFNCDDPTSGSQFALAIASTGCGTIVSSNFARANAPGVIPLNKRWVTWITRPQIPPFASAGPNDLLLVAHVDWQKAAVASGWPSTRVSLAPWPSLQLLPTQEKSLAIFVDTVIIKTPSAIEDMSSQRVLWDLIESELQTDPLAIDGDAGRYLDNRARRLDIASDTLDRFRFLDGLILPTYQQGIARLLVNAELPVKLHGKGWNQLEEFRPFATGPVQTETDFVAAAQSSAVLVYIWPKANPHPIESLSKPILYPSTRRSDQFLKNAQSLLNGPAAKPSANGSLASELKRLL